MTQFFVVRLKQKSAGGFWGWFSFPDKKRVIMSFAPFFILPALDLFMRHAAGLGSEDKALYVDPDITELLNEFLPRP